MTTPAPDALRLVPVEPTPEMLSAWQGWREYDVPDHWPESLRPIYGGYRAMLAASPAVQPAAGREEIVRKEIRAWTDTQWPKNCRVGSASWVNGLARRILAAISTPAQASGEAVNIARFALNRIYLGHASSPKETARLALDEMDEATLAHPPAQASETGGEATGAEAVVRDGQIVISVAVDALPLILSGSIATNAVAGTFKVTDAETFAKEVCSSLNAEKEDGTTRVHMMFDSAFNHAIEQGAEGVEDISEDEFEMEAARLDEAALSAPQAAPGEGEQS